MCVTSLTSIDLALKWALFCLHRIEVFAFILDATARETEHVNQNWAKCCMT